MIFGQPTIEKTWFPLGEKYPCYVWINHLGYRCGYVGVTADHPFFGVDRWDDKLLEVRGLVHGGLTFSGKMDWENSSNFWFLGFDCAHLGDAPIPGWAPGMDDLKTDGETVRSLEYVVENCETLAKALSEKSQP